MADLTNSQKDNFPWIDALYEGVILIESGRVQFVNQTAAAFLEVNPDAVMGLPVIAVLRDHRLEQAYLKGETMELNTRGRTLLSRPIDGGLLLTDISETRHAQETARDLLAVLSHELRTPATTIRSTLEALRHDMPPQQRERFLERAEIEMQRLIRLIEDLTVDVKPPVYRRISLTETVERALIVLQTTLEEHGITLEQNISDILVFADADKLLQVLINLIENAAIHGPDHSTVSLCSHIDVATPDVVNISVHDYGEPLEPETIEKLFEPHSRGSSVKSKGTGLGLYIVRSLARRWNGDAWGKPLEQGNAFGFTVRLAV